MSTRLDRRAVLQGVGGVALALPVLDAMGEEVANNAAAALLRPLHRQRHVAAEPGPRHRRMELVSRTAEKGG